MYLHILFAILLAAYGQLASADGPGVAAARQTVDKLNAALIDAMKNADRLGYQGRYKRLDPVVKDVFQFEAVAQIALGSHWKKLDQSQKLAFMAKLTDLSVATYAAQFNSYGGEKFQYESSEELKADRITLRYAMVVPNEKPIKFEYIVNHFNVQWVIINIIVDGISDLALKKAQYTSVIDREGFDKLLDKLQTKISDYAKNNK
jgi:phospholipid transport system substrate-binding protein